MCTSVSNYYCHRCKLEMTSGPKMENMYIKRHCWISARGPWRDFKKKSISASLKAFLNFTFFKKLTRCVNVLATMSPFMYILYNFPKRHICVSKKREGKSCTQQESAFFCGRNFLYESYFSHKFYIRVSLFCPYNIMKLLMWP